MARTTTHVEIDRAPDLLVRFEGCNDSRNCGRGPDRAQAFIQIDGLELVLQFDSRTALEALRAAIEHADRELAARGVPRDEAHREAMAKGAA